MRKKLFVLLVWKMVSCLLLTAWINRVRAQSVVSSRTFTSQVAGVDGATVNDMVKMDRDLLYAIQRAPFGIMGTINAPGGSIKVSIYADDPALNITRLIFQTTITWSCPTHYGADLNTIVNPVNYDFGGVQSNDPFTLSMVQFTNDYPGSGIISLKGKIPVIVEFVVIDATFIQALLPGIGIYTLDFPWGHPYFGSTSEERNTLREFRMGNFNDVVVIPHRGVWGTDPTPEGGMMALKAAERDGFSFAELDIRLSKDKWPILFRDQEINRMSNLLPTPDRSELASVANLNAYNTSPDIPIRNPNDPSDQNYGTYLTYPALSSGYLKNRYGLENEEDPINDLASALNFLQGSKMFLILDIQEKILDDYLLATYQCLKMAKDRGMLHKIIFKYGSTAFLSREALQEYLSNPAPDHPENLWSDYAYKTSTIVSIHPADVNDPMGDAQITGMDPATSSYGLIRWINLYNRIEDWMKLPSVIGFEVIFKCEIWDPMLTANINATHTAAFNGKSVVQYLKNMSYRTGNQWEIPTDCRGLPDGRGSWYGKSNKVAEPYLSYSPDCYDLRGNPEWMIHPPGYMEDIDPGFIITDRSYLLVEICNGLERLHPITFRE